MAAAVRIAAGALQGLLARHCPSCRLDLAGAVALPAPLPHAEMWRDWIASDLHGGLEYLSPDPEPRVDPTRNNPWAHSLLVFAQRYSDGWEKQGGLADQGATPGRDWLAGVSRYARGRDYHDVLLADIRALLNHLQEALPDLRSHPSVDTGPYLEREYAWLAGLGFWGKNTCLLHERLGSSLFLGVALTNLEITGLRPAGVPASEPLWGVRPRQKRGPETQSVASRCGRCRRCLDACPTGALVAPFRLDAGKCLSTWTIEWRGRAPTEKRPRQGPLLFGCDLCQAVCPWNHKASRQSDEMKLSPVPAEYAALPEHEALSLADLLSLPADAFREHFRRTPLWRAHPEGLRRNALTVAANTGRRDLVEEIQAVANNDADSEVRDVARWALVRLGEVSI